jgi:transcriptional regulator with XRE-family HTH domain
MRTTDLDPGALPRDTSETTGATMALCQNPHAVPEVTGNQLEVAIGREVRAYRRKHGMTIMDLARAAGLSLGMMSKIENGIISASLTTLQALSRALAVPLTSLLKRSEDVRDAMFVKAGAGISIERCGTRASNQYSLLGYIDASMSEVSVEPYLVSLTEDVGRLTLLQHAGMKFIYMLEGEIAYRHGATLYGMSPGDSLFFDAASPHGPDQLLKLPVRFVSIVSYRLGRAAG